MAWGIATMAGTCRQARDGTGYQRFSEEGDGESRASFVISLDHLEQILDSPRSKGAKRGARVSFTRLDGVHLGEMDVLGLIRSGYIG
jgi:hypothetical protein